MAQTDEDKILISYDYQDVKEETPCSMHTITEVFKRFEDDAGLIVSIRDKEFYFESMEDYYDGILTCVEDDGVILRGPREVFQSRMTMMYY
jgi:hypothetical protein